MSTKQYLKLREIIREKGGGKMIIIATIKGCNQVGIDIWENKLKSYIFESSDTIDEMLKITGVKTLDEMNLSEVTEKVIYSNGNKKIE